MQPGCGSIDRRKGFPTRMSPGRGDLVPRRKSRDDAPANGLCLCRWSFDEGLTAAGRDYEAPGPDRVRPRGNMPAHIPTLTGRRSFKPAVKYY